MSHVTLRNESNHDIELVTYSVSCVHRWTTMSPVRMSHVTRRVRMSHVTHRVRMSHVTRKVRMSHVTHMNESCHTYEGDTHARYINDKKSLKLPSTGPVRLKTHLTMHPITYTTDTNTYE